MEHTKEWKQLNDGLGDVGKGITKLQQERGELLEALKDAARAIYRASDYMPTAGADMVNGIAYKRAMNAIARAEGIDPDYENAEAQREATQ